jgi:3-oxoacyl-[acyl-carrier-protein] synthase-3
MRAAIQAIEYHLPEALLDNATLAKDMEGWSAEKIAEKTGINSRHIVAEGECASDLAVKAAEKLLASPACPRESIDFVLLCTQSPDYFLPTTACLLQHRLKLRDTCGALDFNLGCSGFVYGLGLAKGLIETGQAQKILLITAETYSRFIHPRDKSVRTIFGDAAAATVVSAMEGNDEPLGPFIFGTDGSGAENLIVPTGGLRRAAVADAAETEDESGNLRTVNNLFMNGPEILNFTLKRVPPVVNALLARAQLCKDQVDLWVFHQANRYMLDSLRKKMAIPEDRFVISMAHCGNTVSSTIPIALRELQAQGRLRAGMRLALVGFGVGYSWSAAMVRWA